MPPIEFALSLVGVGLTFFGIAFTVWATKLKEVMLIAEKIDTRLIDLGAAFHGYQVDTERRLSWLESRTNGHKFP